MFLRDEGFGKLWKLSGLSCWGEMPSTSQIWVHFPHLNYTIWFRYFYMVAVSGEQRKNIHGLNEGSVGDRVELDGSRILSRGNTGYSIILEGKKARRWFLKSISDFSGRKLREEVTGSCLIQDLSIGEWKG